MAFGGGGRARKEFFKLCGSCAAPKAKGESRKRERERDTESEYVGAKCKSNRKLSRPRLAGMNKIVVARFSDF